MGLRRRCRHDRGRPVRKRQRRHADSGPTWTTAGKYGNALSFDGVNDLVTVADANSLDLTNGMTLEAWVRPTALGNNWRTALMKESSGSLSYALYAAGTDGTKVPEVEIFSGGFRTTNAPHRWRSTPGRTSQPPSTARPSGSSSTAPRRHSCSSPARSRPPPAPSASAATTSGANGSRARSTKSASTTGRSAAPRSRPT